MASSVRTSSRPRSRSRLRTFDSSMSTICFRFSRFRRVEDDHVVEAVEELGAEVPLDRDLEPLLHLLVARGVVAAAVEAEDVARRGRLGPDVGGHDHDRVLEVDVAAEAVGQPAFLHDLEEHVEDVGVRLLDLVEQDDRVGAAADLLGELAALLVADVARRGADRAGETLCFSMYSDMSIWIRASSSPNMNSARRLGEQRLADAGRARGR